MVNFNEFIKKRDNIFNTFKKKDPTKLYSFKQKLGSGASGDVYGAVKRGTNDVFAIKVVNLEDWDLKDLKNEITLMSICSHENIVKYIDTYDYR